MYSEGEQSRSDTWDDEQNIGGGIQCHQRSRAANNAVVSQRFPTASNRAEAPVSRPELRIGLGVL